MAKKFERRMAVTGLEVREGSDAITLTGYASTFNQPYDMGWYTETVDPGAFKRTLGQYPDVRLLVNHDGLPLARTSSGTLTLDTDSKGLRVSSELDMTDPDVLSLVPKMKRGDLNQMSFAFRTIEDIWEDDMSKRTLRALDLNDGDVSVVTYPANPNAEAALRAGDVTSVDAIASALRTLESRSAKVEDVAAVLTRALRFFEGLDLANAEIVDLTDEPAADELDDDTEPVVDPEAEGDRAAAVSHELRERLLALVG